MINNIRPYPTYKSSPLPWLHKLPIHWQLLRGKALFQTVDVRSDSGKEELLTVSSAHGVVKRRQANVTMFKAESYVGYKLCWPGDLVINSLWAWAGGLGFSAYHGIVSTAYSVFRLKQNDKWSQMFFHYLARSLPFQWELQTRSKGVWISRLQITDESFLNILFPCPPLPEQRAIVKFLDWADRRIRLIIAARKRRIQLLEEYRQTLINDAVTGKFDVCTGKPYPAYKDSGVEWLEKVPEEWSIKPLKHWVHINPNTLPENANPDFEFEYYDISSVGTGKLIGEPEILEFKDAPSRARRLLQPGDTVFSTVRTGKVKTPDSPALRPLDLQCLALVKTASQAMWDT